MTDTPSKDDTAAAPRPPAADQEWASLAASLGADKAVRAVPGKASAEPPHGVQRAVVSSTVALLFAFVAIMIAGMLWWQYRQFYVSLDQTDTAAAEALARVRAEQRALQDNLADANDDVDTLRQLNTSPSMHYRDGSSRSRSGSTRCRAARSMRAALCCARKPSIT